MRTLLLLTSLLFCLNVSAQERTFTGWYFGISTGTWFPDRAANSTLGHPLMFGLMFDVKPDKNSVSFNFDMVGIGLNRTTKPLTITMPDTVVTENSFFGLHVTLDYARELWAGKNVMIEGVCGAGYGKMIYYNPDADTDLGKGSFIASPGLGIRRSVGKGNFLQLKVQYMLANYNSPKVSPELRGNYVVTKLTMGLGGRRN